MEISNPIIFACENGRIKIKKVLNTIANNKANCILDGNSLVTSYLPFITPFKALRSLLAILVSFKLLTFVLINSPFRSI